MGSQAQARHQIDVRTQYTPLEDSTLVVGLVQRSIAGCGDAKRERDRTKGRRDGTRRRRRRRNIKLFLRQR